MKSVWMGIVRGRQPCYQRKLIVSWRHAKVSVQAQPLNVGGWGWSSGECSLAAAEFDGHFYRTITPQHEKASSPTAVIHAQPSALLHAADTVCIFSPTLQGAGGSRAIKTKVSVCRLIPGNPPVLLDEVRSRPGVTSHKKHRKEDRACVRLKV